MKNEQQKKEYLLKLRHSAEHVLHDAVQNLYPTVLKAMGPATDEGFYFDFDPNGETISEADFEKLEAEMQKIINKKLPIVKKDISVDEAKKLFKDNPYKLEWVEEHSKDGGNLTVYWTGEPDKEGSTVDLCKGPHVDNTSEIKAFKLLSIAGAYWRGDSKNKMLTRIYGTAFESKEELDKYLWQIEESKKRDHRKLGKELELFTFASEVGAGLPIWLPKGTIIKDEIEKWGKETEEKWGYDRVSTPFLTKRELFELSGHVPYFEDEMYKVEVPGEDKEETYFIRPMNCPFHHIAYKSKIRSYRDLPLRLAEYGNVARYELSGTLNGILRPRAFVQNDAHVYCSEAQAVDEFVEIIKLHQYYYDTLGLNDYYIVLALRDPNKKDKYHGEEALWQKSEELSRAAMEKAGIKYVVEDEGAAHYGPKMDFKIKSVIGTEYGISTNQIDLFMPRRFDLKFVNEQGQEEYVIVQHRAPLGSTERFVGFLIEHFAGAFPVWLSPVQVQIISISDKSVGYAKEIMGKLTESQVRVELDDKDESMGNKIRKAQEQKVPYMIIIGEKEANSKNISVRLRTGEQLNNIKLEEFIDRVNSKINSKSLDL